jgi:glycosyltransferase involved in cell wall biosynthesis
MLADWCRRWRERGWTKTEEVLAHGTEEPIEFLERFPYLQELSPFYADRHRNRQRVFCIPNFIDSSEYAVGGQEEKIRSRKELGLSVEDVIVCSIGALNSNRKRMDWVVSEIGKCRNKDVSLAMAGPLERGGRQIIEQGRSSLGESFIYLGALPREKMKLLYHASDICVLASLEEIFGITWLEAMACGLPCVGHTFPVTEWILEGRCNRANRCSRCTGEKSVGGGREDVECGTWDVERGPGINPGWLRQKWVRRTKNEERRTRNQGSKTPNAELGTDAGGICIDMTEAGELAKAIDQLAGDAARRQSLGDAARKRVETMFSKEAVIPQMLEMYGEVMRGL